MIRTVVRPENQNISIKLPKEFVGKQVEVIAFTVEEANQAKEIVDKTLTHFASEKVLEIGKTYIMGNNKTATQETIGTNVETTITANSSEVHGISDENFLYVLNRTIEETKRAKIENTYLRLMQKH